MPWVVGIDEAGYGPNLGPLAQVATTVWLPDEDLAGWDALNPLIRRSRERGTRLLIDDSKKVHSGVNGLTKLMHGVCGWLGIGSHTLTDLLTRFGLPDVLADTRGEHWFDPDDTIDCQTPPLSLPLGPTFVNLVHPPAFNRRVDATNSKATVLADGVIRLLPAVFDAIPDDRPVHVTCDKQGGRNLYGPLLQAAFPDGLIFTRREHADESRYLIRGLTRELTVVFRPRADGDSVAVAVASMFAKYLRELCMLRFNAFWAKHVPGLVPTAGYPVDAKRFFADIHPAVTAIGLADDAVWRKR